MDALFDEKLFHGEAVAIDMALSAHLSYMARGSNNASTTHSPFCPSVRVSRSLLSRPTSLSLFSPLFSESLSEGYPHSCLH